MIFPTILFTEIWADEEAVNILLRNNLARLDSVSYKPILTSNGVDLFINYGHLSRQQFKDFIKSMDPKNANK